MLSTITRQRHTACKVCKLKVSLVRIDNSNFIDERRRSKRVVTLIYALMALAFSLVALIIGFFGAQLSLADSDTRFLTVSFTNLSAANLLVLEFWQRTLARN